MISGSKKQNIKYYFLAILTAVAILVWSAVWAEDRGGILTVAFLNVGQGDAIFIDAPNGNQVLMDGGPNKTVLKELSAVMSFYDRSLDMLIMSHPNLDHIGGLVEALKRYEVGTAVDSGASHSIGEYAEWKRLIANNGVKYLQGSSGVRIHLADGVYLDVLSPKKGEPLQSKNINDVMLTARLVYGNTSFLLTGDMERTLEYKLVDGGSALDATVLKVGHHGSRTSSSEYFLNAVHPKYAVIQVGKNNKYGHPHQEILNRLQAAGIGILRTDTDGRIIFRSDGKNLALEK
ncbi:MAG: MBL fold metallo-hydrolase [Candidatus Niyogibacteria bacterium]|nr:MBL fold metallo-hydrolase [Candidatus Niyogibacteria bacterium]